MRRILLYAILAGLVTGGLWVFQNHDHALGTLQRYIENTELVTLEAKYTPEEIMEAHKRELLFSPQHSFRSSSLNFHPYLMMEVKYAQPKKLPREGVLFWSLVDGEMVLNADTWEKSHGFEDAINVDASQNDFKLMNTLAKSKGTANIDQLQKELHIEKDTLKAWIESAAAKYLVVQKGSDLQLHFQDPKISVDPETKITSSFVTKSYDNASQTPRKYSTRQIQKITRAAFGDDFKIRSTTEVFLPIYDIEVLNPDGSIRRSYWNALNGERILPKYLVK